jgi:hypothetical protein
MFFGRGTMVHTDTKNSFEGEFLDHLKHGKSEFLLSEGYKFEGTFQFGTVVKSDYGKRF